MQTLEIEDGGDEQGSKDQIIPGKATKSSATEAISNQEEMIAEILSTLPVKTLLQFRCVSKPWLNLISHQSFVKLHNSRARHHGFVISAYNKSTSESYFLFASDNDVSSTHILTMPDRFTYPHRAQHVNGFLLFCPVNGFDKNYLAFVYNPSTRNIFKVPRGYDVPEVNKIHYCYLLAFDESSSEHKILNFKTIGDGSSGNFKRVGLEIEIFSLSTYTWRKIDVDFPFDPSVAKFFDFHPRRVCVNGVMYFMHHDTKSILLFDLRTETFSSMNFPPVNFDPCLVCLKAIGGSLGAFPFQCKVDSNKMEFWILRDCKNKVWVKDTIRSITLPNCWKNQVRVDPYIVDFRGGEIVFMSNEVSGNVLSIPLYDMEKGTFRSVEVNLSHNLLCSKTLHVHLYEVTSYVESMMPLKNSSELVSLISGKGNDKRSTTNSQRAHLQG